MAAQVRQRTHIADVLSSMVLSSHAIASGVYGRQSSAIFIYDYDGAVGLGDLVGAAPSNVAEEHVFRHVAPAAGFNIGGGDHRQSSFQINIAGVVRHKR